MHGLRKTALLAAGSAAFLLAAGARAQDFSQMRMREGRDAYRARRFAEAAGLFRVAAFGLLDRPPALCEALVRLALAQQAAGGAADVKVSLDRLAETQRRAPTCADAELDAATRAEFETRLRRKWPPTAPGSATAAGAAEPSPFPGGEASAERLAPAPSAGRPAPVYEADPADADGAGVARLKTVVHPIYPRTALQQRIGGVVILRVLVSEEGQPLQVEVVQGIRPDLNAAAVSAIKKCVFEPARVGGRPVRASTTVSVPFQP